MSHFMKKSIEFNSIEPYASQEWLCDFNYFFFFHTGNLPCTTTLYIFFMLDYYNNAKKKYIIQEIFWEGSKKMSIERKCIYDHGWWNHNRKVHMKKFSRQLNHSGAHKPGKKHVGAPLQMERHERRKIEKKMVTIFLVTISRECKKRRTTRVVKRQGNWQESLLHCNFFIVIFSFLISFLHGNFLWVARMVLHRPTFYMQEVIWILMTLFLLTCQPMFSGKKLASPS